MFQFRREEAAVLAAKLLAVREVGPILVVAGAGGNVFSIGLRTNAALREAGRHVATVYWSGQVDYEYKQMHGPSWPLVNHDTVSRSFGAR
jgi:hypothetical protein